MLQKILYMKISEQETSIIDPKTFPVKSLLKKLNVETRRVLLSFISEDDSLMSLLLLQPSILRKNARFGKSSYAHLLKHLRKTYPLSKEYPIEDRDDFKSVLKKRIYKKPPL